MGYHSLEWSFSTRAGRGSARSCAYPLLTTAWNRSPFLILFTQTWGVLTCVFVLGFPARLPPSLQRLYKRALDWPESADFLHFHIPSCVERASASRETFYWGSFSFRRFLSQSCQSFSNFFHGVPFPRDSRPRPPVAHLKSLTPLQANPLCVGPCSSPSLLKRKDMFV